MPNTETVCVLGSSHLSDLVQTQKSSTPQLKELPAYVQDGRLNPYRQIEAIELRYDVCLGTGAAPALFGCGEDFTVMFERGQLHVEMHNAGTVSSVLQQECHSHFDSASSWYQYP